MTRVLKPGGRLVLPTPFDERLSDKMIRCPHCENDFHSRGHQRSFVDNAFRSLAVNHGLEVVELFAIRYSRLRRFRFLGTGICGSRRFKNGMRRANGKRHLVLRCRETAIRFTKRPDETCCLTGPSRKPVRSDCTYNVASQIPAALLARRGRWHRCHSSKTTRV